MHNIKYTDPPLSDEEYRNRIAKYGPKFSWFMQHGYQPHYYQALFHTMETDDKLTRFRHLVAGRRGGKTLCAIWEVMYYCQNPAAYWREFHNKESDDPLWIWMLAKDYKLGSPARLGFRKALKDSNLVYGEDYREHKTERFFEFPKTDTLVEFKTADHP